MAEKHAAGVDARSEAVRRLSSLFGTAVLAQAAIFIALTALIRFAAHLVIDAIASANAGGLIGSASVVVAICVILLDIVVALMIGFMGARRLIDAIVRATPHPAKPPIRPVPLAGACAAGIAVAVSLIVFANDPQAGASPLAWVLELLRDAAVIAVFWYGARRAVFPVSAR